VGPAENGVTFQEVQTLGRWAWPVAGVIGLSNLVVPLVAVVARARRGRRRLFGRRPAWLTIALAIPATIPPMFVGALALAWIFSTRLVTEVRSDGLYFRYRPIFRGFRRIGFDEIASVEAIRYSPLLDYGGWGIRFGIRGQGVAFTTKGNRGVMVLLKDGNRRLIGSQRADELVQAIRQGAEPRA
jgi:hypothetical protein